MKNIKRVLALVLCMVMVFSCLSMNALAADGEPNAYMEVDKTEVNIGDTITVSVNYTDMVVSSFACTLKFDKDLLECVSIEGCDPEYPEDIGLCTKRSFVPGTASSTPAEANGIGQAGFAYAGTKEATYLECTVFIATFTAKAAGVAELVLVEDSAGADSYQGTAGSAAVTIKGSEPEPPAHECTPSTVSYEKGENGNHIKVEKCECGETVNSTTEACSGGAADCENAAVCEFCGNTYGAAKGHGNLGFRYSHVAGTDTHDVICVECEETVEENVACTFEDGSHVCKFACGNETDCSDAAGDKDHDCDVCGKPGLTECSGGTATCKDKAVCSECGKEYGEIDPNAHMGEKETEYTDNGANHTVKEYYAGCGHEISSKTADHEYGDGFACICGNTLAGWQQKDGAWYYVVNGKPVTGTVRVPYPTDAINGKTYGPNAEDVEYSKNNADSKYSDAKTAMFMFGDDGKFDYTTNGLVDGGKRYAVDGVIVWHVGLVEINGEYYYFIGDENGGGNIAAEGDIYVSRLNGIAGFEKGAVYNFAGGKLSGLNGFIDRYNDGKMFYYENSKLMLGAGLIKVDGGYIYVRSNGMVAIGKYWVTNHNGICESGMYNFGEDGYMQSIEDPSVNGLKDGVYYKNGMPYYAGLIEIDGATYYINSAGEAVTGTYYITKLDNYTGSLDVQRGDKLTFAADGKLVTE